MTYRLQLPTNFQDDTLPRFTIDPILTTGSVWLVDPAHPLDPWGSGVPSNNDPIPNLVSAHPELLPDGIDAAMPLTYLTDGLIAGEFGLVERTEKGGLHVILSREDSSDFLSHSSNKYYAAIRHANDPATEWTSYLYGSNGADGAYQHGYYLSTWLRITRPQESGDDAAYAALVGRSSQGHMNVAHRLHPDKPHRQSPQIQGVTEGLHFNASSSTGPLVTASPNPTSNTDFYVVPFMTAHYLAYGRLSGVRENAPSVILYRSYLEDLTVSGRTFEEVAAIDQALFTRDCLTEGGRYYDDEFTDPEEYFEEGS